MCVWKESGCSQGWFLVGEEELHLGGASGSASDWGRRVVIGFWKPGQSVIGASGITAPCCQVTEAEREIMNECINDWMKEDVLKIALMEVMQAVGSTNCFLKHMGASLSFVTVCSAVIYPSSMWQQLQPRPVLGWTKKRKTNPENDSLWSTAAIEPLWLKDRNTHCVCVTQKCTDPDKGECMCVAWRRRRW